MTAPGAVIDGVDVDAVAAAVRGCPGVDDLFSSTVDSVTSYLPGRQVAGIRVAADAVTVQIRAAWAVPFPRIAAGIQLAVAALGGGRRIDVVVADICDPSAPTNGQSAWTTSTAQPDVPSSGPTIPIAAATPPPS